MWRVVDEGNPGEVVAMFRFHADASVWIARRNLLGLCRYRILPAEDDEEWPPVVDADGNPAIEEPQP